MDEGPSISEADDVDDDPIVKEIPIIHSKRLESNLFLFQYPFMRKDCPNNEMVIKKCQFKPVNEEVKLEMGINVESPHFDTVRAEFIAQEVNGQLASGSSSMEDKKVPKFFENDVVDKVILESCKATKKPEKYAVAAFNGSEIHLTAIKGILQMRPSFPYLGKGLKRRKDAGAKTSDSEEDDPSYSAQQVTVKFKNEDRWKKTPEASFKNLQEKRAGEAWLDYAWHEKDSSLSSVERLKLVSETTEETGQAQSLDQSEYLRLLVPEDEEQANLTEPSLPCHVFSLHSLRQLPLLEQCRILLKDAQIVQFQQILLLLAGGEGLNQDVLLKTLPKVAVLVRGNWVVKSEVLYPANTFSSISGVPSELMCKARDYVLYLFTRNYYVERKKVSSLIKIPSEEVKEIFTGISKLRHNKGWELSLPTDQEFLVKHTDIVQKQMAFWEQRYHQLTEFLKDNKEKRQRRKSKSVSEEKFRTKSVSSDNDSGTERNHKSPILARKTQKTVSKEDASSS